MKPTLLVLAAGMGSRYGGLKQMDPFGPHGETIIDYSIYDAIRSGFGKVVFVIRPDFAELFKKELGSRFETRIQVDYAYQELSKVPSWFSIPQGREKPWGTGHAILMAEQAVKEPFAMINADDFYGAEGFEIMARYLEHAKDAALADYSMVGYVLEKTLSEHGTVSRGVCEMDADGSLKAVVEQTKIEKLPHGAKDQLSGTSFTGEEIVSMNFFGFTPSLFSHLRSQFDAFLRAQGQELKSEFFIPGVVDRLIKAKAASVNVLRSTGQWFGVTYREDKPLVQAGIQRLIDSGAYPSNLRG
jgi:UTP-glucose-1-phosphate uridylyltransferase